MSPELLAAVSGIILSLAFSYIPGLNKKFAALQSDYKRLIMLGALFVVAAGALGLGCIGRYNLYSCVVDGVWKALETFIMAAIANQSAYALTPKGE